MVQQLTIFDVPTTTFEIGNTVEVVVNVTEKEVEDYYYLKEFQGVRGRVIKGLRGQQYEVLFAKCNRVGIFRQSELRRG
ncbi:hypothetical protein [Sporosarcina sp. NPDC096371]|uniref:hypothetical protein n=1 Tax=Sporosarcina sp. NPDC096371 TaxID=3364530 RepID=UPI0038277417